MYVRRRYLSLRFDPSLKFMPLEVAMKAPPANNTKNVNMMYVAAPLRPRCTGWHPEWGKAWESWGAPSYTY